MFKKFSKIFLFNLFFIGYLGLAQTEDLNKQLREAVKAGHIETAEMLIDMGADIEVRDWDGETALHTAVANGRTKTAKMLINKGADIEARDWDGETAYLDECDKSGKKS